jgi:putative membrane-bound dehydrogenase-like protein
MKTSTHSARPVRSRSLWLAGWVLGAAVSVTLGAAPPRASDTALRVQPFAAEPDIVTPIGIAVTPSDRVLVLESHTHKRPSNYSGPASDQVKELVDADGDGRAETARVVASGIREGLTIALAPSGELFVCYRIGVARFRDGNGDGVFEQRDDILKLETDETYPHNCLLSVAVSRDGWVYVGRGNTGGRRWTMRGSNGATLRGFGDGGNIVRCRFDGSGLEEFSTGFWNPFGLAFDGAGNLFSADNDPDSRGPNRIVHAIRGGDYGFKARYGKTGLHPFVAWNGELPGTLPFVTGVGESPGTLMDLAGTVAARDDTKELLVAVWAEERLDRVTLKPHGASWRGSVEPFLKGDETFRPVAMAAGPDGSIYVTDWASRDYANHGKGRVWKIAAKPEEARAVSLSSQQKLSVAVTPKSFESRDPFVRSAAIAALGNKEHEATLLAAAQSRNAQVRAHALLALRRAQLPSAESLARRFLSDRDETIRFLAMIWAAEEGFTNLARNIEAAAQRPPTSSKLYRAALETEQWLARAHPNHPEHNTPGFLLKSTLPAAALEKALLEEQRPAELRAFALATLPPDSVRAHEAKVLVWATRAGPLQSAAVWALGFAPSASGAGALEALSNNPRVASALRADAVIARSMASVHETGFAEALVDDKVVVVRRAARLVLGKSRENDRGRPTDTAGWQKATARGGDVAHGRRLFYSPQLGCAKCHRAEGRGGELGPDLSGIGQGTPRSRLVASIVEPSREVSVDFQGYTLETKDGESWQGVQGKPRQDGERIAIELLTMDGQKLRVPMTNVVHFAPMTLSLMPDGLAEAMSVEDLRDLVAYLESLK